MLCHHCLSEYASHTSSLLFFPNLPSFSTLAILNIYKLPRNKVVPIHKNLTEPLNKYHLFTSYLELWVFWVLRDPSPMKTHRHWVLTDDKRLLSVSSTFSLLLQHWHLPRLNLTNIGQSSMWLRTGPHAFIDYLTK